MCTMGVDPSISGRCAAGAGVRVWVLISRAIQRMQATMASTMQRSAKLCNGVRGYMGKVLSMSGPWSRRLAELGEGVAAGEVGDLVPSGAFEEAEGFGEVHGGGEGEGGASSGGGTTKHMKHTKTKPGGRVDWARWEM